MIFSILPTLHWPIMQQQPKHGASSPSSILWRNPICDPLTLLTLGSTVLGGVAASKAEVPKAPQREAVGGEVEDLGADVQLGADTTAEDRKKKKKDLRGTATVTSTSGATVPSGAGISIL